MNTKAYLYTFSHNQLFFTSESVCVCGGGGGGEGVMREDMVGGRWGGSLFIAQESFQIKSNTGHIPVSKQQILLHDNTTKYHHTQ